MRKLLLLVIFWSLLTFFTTDQQVDAACALIHPHTVTSAWYPSAPDRRSTRIENTYYWDDHFEQNEYYGSGQGYSNPCGASGNCDAIWSNEIFSDVGSHLARWSIKVQDRSGSIPYPIHCELFCSDNGTQREEVLYYTCQ